MSKKPTGKSKPFLNNDKLPTKDFFPGRPSRNSSGNSKKEVELGPFGDCPIDSSLLEAVERPGINILLEETEEFLEIGQTVVQNYTDSRGNGCIEQMEENRFPKFFNMYVHDASRSDWEYFPPKKKEDLDTIVPPPTPHSSETKNELPLSRKCSESRGNSQPEMDLGSVEDQSNDLRCTEDVVGELVEETHIFPEIIVIENSASSLSSSAMSISGRSSDSHSNKIVLLEQQSDEVVQLFPPVDSTDLVENVNNINIPEILGIKCKESSVAEKIEFLSTREPYSSNFKFEYIYATTLNSSGSCEEITRSKGRAKRFKKKNKIATSHGMSVWQEIAKFKEPPTAEPSDGCESSSTTSQDYEMSVERTNKSVFSRTSLDVPTKWSCKYSFPAITNVTNSFGHHNTDDTDLINKLNENKLVDDNFGRFKKTARKSFRCSTLSATSNDRKSDGNVSSSAMESTLMHMRKNQSTRNSFYSISSSSTEVDEVESHDSEHNNRTFCSIFRLCFCTKQTQ